MNKINCVNCDKFFIDKESLNKHIAETKGCNVFYNSCSHTLIDGSKGENVCFRCGRDLVKDLGYNST
jgi:hypothetical protein